jgi:hypothetical protein
MTSSVFYDEIGKIVEIRGGNIEGCTLDIEEDDRPGLVTEEIVDFDTHFVADNTLRKMPPRPSIEHVFDYAARNWVYDPTPAQQQAALQMRFARNAKLEACDWTQMPDTPLSTEQQVAWQTYRQQLRDLPANYPDATSIDDVIFPTPPSI